MSIAWPIKTRELHNHHFDASIWNDFRFRDDDIVIATYAKSGTTWMQQIVAQLLLGPDPNIRVAECSPWMDLRVPPKDVKLAAVESIEHRRFIKTHLPVDALVYSPKAKYLYIGRDGRDVLWSLYNHHRNANATWYETINNSPGRVGPPIAPPTEDILSYFREWMTRDGFPFWSFWDNVSSWWAIRDLPNLKLVHFADLKRDMEGEIRRIAAFLECDVAPDAWPEILEYCSFEWMKKNGDALVPAGGAFWEGGSSTFVNKGVNGRWTEVLTPKDVAAYESRALEVLGADGARWLTSGAIAA